MNAADDLGQESMVHSRLPFLESSDPADLRRRSPIRAGLGEWDVLILKASAYPSRGNVKKFLLFA
jgi:hypothetical protein